MYTAQYLFQKASFADLDLILIEAKSCEAPAKIKPQVLQSFLKYFKRPYNSGENIRLIK
jgi:hypothetical protein